jgi:hypothetical protein
VFTSSTLNRDTCDDIVGSQRERVNRERRKKQLCTAGAAAAAAAAPQSTTTSARVIVPQPTSTSGPPQITHIHEIQAIMGGQI